MPTATCLHCSGLGACPKCGGSGDIEIHGEGCDRYDCPDSPVYYYYNQHSGAEGAFCADHLADLRSDVPMEYWIENGFAKPTNNT